MKGVLAYTMKDMNEERKKQNISSNINVSNYKDSETEKMLQRIKKFRLLDDDFMIVCFENNIEATELVLIIILEKPDIIVKTVQTQYTMKNIKGRSVRLDIYATDADNKKYNIEIQRADKGAGAKRARYNSSLIDSNIIPAGSDIEDLPETFVIFITENDVLGKGKSIYHINRYIEEIGEYFNDGSHIIYVNAATTEKTALGQLMSDFRATTADEMKNKVLADTVRHFKEDEEGVSVMCKIMEEVKAEGEIIGKVKLLYQDFGMSISDIAIKLRISNEEVEKIVKEEILCVK